MGMECLSTWNLAYANLIQNIKIATPVMMGWNFYLPETLCMQTSFKTSKYQDYHTDGMKLLSTWNIAKGGKGKGWEGLGLVLTYRLNAFGVCF